MVFAYVNRNYVKKINKKYGAGFAKLDENRSLTDSVCLRS